MEETKQRAYSLEKLAEFRKSIQAMGDPINNGTVEIPMGLTKGRRLLDKIKPEEICRTSYSDVLAWRKYSRVYYAHPLYKRLLDYFANIYYNQYIISPTFPTSKKPSKKRILDNYNSVLRSLDEDIQVESFSSKVLLDLLIEGETYYFIESYKKGASYYFKPIKLPTDYCRIIGTAGTPAVNIFAVDLTFIDVAMTEFTKNNILTREEVLKQYPKELRNAYNTFKNGKTDSQWFVVPVDNCAAFTTPDGRPPFAFLIKEIAKIEKYEILRDDYIATNLTKVLVQIIDIDKEGNPEIDLALAAEFHKNLREIASKKANVDALTTLAKEVDVLTLGETGDAASNYEFLETYYDQFYDDAGVSSELFNSTTGSTLAESQLRDMAYMYKMREQIAVWINFYLGVVCHKTISKDTKFVFSYLDTSYMNREKMIESYTTGATYGFSKIVPQVALGVKQRYIESLNTFENDILNLNEKLVPLQSSHTMSSNTDESKSGTTTEEANDVEVSGAGRPSLDESDKQDSTVSKEASL